MSTNCCLKTACVCVDNLNGKLCRKCSTRGSSDEDDAFCVDMEEDDDEEYEEDVLNRDDYDYLDYEDGNTEGGTVFYPIPEPYKREEKIGRNDPCLCGSGLKYKKCHGKNG